MKEKIFIIILWILAIVGEVKCIIKFFQSDFKPSYKRECIYGFSALVGLESIVGWMNFEDELSK